MSLSSTRATFGKHFSMLGFSERPSFPLINHQLFQTEFVPSAMIHSWLSELLDPNGTFDLYRFQQCIRSYDNMLGAHSNHLTYFEMACAVSVSSNHSTGHKFYIESTLNLLGHLNIDIQDLYFTLFAGGPIQSNDSLVFDGLFPSDTISADHLLDLGINRDRIQYNSGIENFSGKSIAEPVAGPRCEIIIDRGCQYNCMNSYLESGNPLRCYPGHSSNCSRYMELVNISLMMYDKLPIIGNDPSKPIQLQLRDHPIFGIATSLERLSCAAEKLGNISNISELAEIGNCFSSLHPQPDLLYNLIDNTRTIYHILATGVQPGRKGRSYITRKIIRKLFEELMILDSDLAPVIQAMDILSKQQNNNKDILLTHAVSLEAALLKEFEYWRALNARTA